MKYDFRKGDVVLIEATVTHNFDKGDSFVFLSNRSVSGSFLLPPEECTMHRPNIQAGEQVILGDRGQWTVKGIDGEMLWLTNPADDYWSADVGSVERIVYADPEPETTAEPITPPPPAPDSNTVAFPGKRIALDSDQEAGI